MSNLVVSDLDFGNSARIGGLPGAIAPGQPLTFEQGSNPNAAYQGGLFASSGPNSTTTTSQSNCTVSTTGTVTTLAQSVGSFRSASRRTRFETAATAGALAGLRTGQTLVWRGNGVGLGGFRKVYRFALDTLVAGQRGFVGLQDTTSAPTNVDPLTSTAGNKIGCAFNIETGNWNLIHNTAGTAPTVISLGADFLINTSDVLTLEVRCLENASGLDWLVTKQGSSAAASGVASLNIPSNTTFLTPYLWTCNNATAALCAMSSMGWVVTSKNS